MKLIKKVERAFMAFVRIGFTRPKKEPKELEIAKAKYSQALAEHNVTDKEFIAAKDGLMEIDNFEKELKKKPEKKKLNIDPTVVVSTAISAGAQYICTRSIEKYNSSGNMFPAKSPSTQWIGSNRWDPIALANSAIRAVQSKFNRG